MLLSPAAFALGAWSANAGSASAAGPVTPQRSFAMAPAPVRTRLIYVANANASNITAYPTSASGNVRPVITLAGPHTQLNNVTALAHDRQGRLFVVNENVSIPPFVTQVLVFARGANGDATPVRSFQVTSYPYFGTNVAIVPVSLAVDYSGYTYVGEQSQNLSDSAAVAVYNPTAQGKDAPLRAFAYGSPFTHPQVAVNAAGQVYVVEPTDRFNGPSLGKFSGFAAGNLGLGGPTFSFSTIDYCCSPGSVAVAPGSSTVYAINNGHITIYNSAFTKAIGLIGGPATGIGFNGSAIATGIAVDGSGQVYVGRPNAFIGPRNSIEMFAASARGNVAPSRTITGSNTGLNDPIAITVID